jgi:hypothetical protein
VNEYSLLGKIIENLGVTGFVLAIVWKLTDRWAGKFLDVQTRQAGAMGDLAAAVRESQGDQKELLLAVRVLAGKVEEQKGWIKELDKHICGLAGGG